jgi:hypothetical protein
MPILGHRWHDSPCRARLSLAHRRLDQSTEFPANDRADGHVLGWSHFAVTVATDHIGRQGDRSHRRSMETWRHGRRALSAVFIRNLTEEDSKRLCDTKA